MNRRMLSVLVFAVSVIGLNMGTSLPLLALRLHEAGAGTLTIGVLSALPAAGMILAALATNWLCRCYGGRTLYLACFMLCSLSSSALEWLPDSLAWLSLSRLALGLGMGVAVILGESWVNELCSEARRGQVVALYAACFTGVQLAGPLLISLLGAHSPWPILLVTLANLLTLVAMSRYLPATWGQHDAHTRPSFSLLGFLRVAPTLCAGVLFFAFFDAVVLSLFPVYASTHGYALGVAALMASVILAGDMLFQVPLGWLADRLNRRTLHLACGVLTLTVGLLLPWLIALPSLLWPALVVLGAVAGGIYTLALILIGQDFRGPDLITANASVGLLWGIGSLAGPLLSGGLMHSSPQGLPLALCLAASGFVIAALGSLIARQKVITQ